MDVMSLTLSWLALSSWRGPGFRAELPFLGSGAGRRACLIWRPRLRKCRRAADRRDAPPSQVRSDAPRTRLQSRQQLIRLNYETIRAPFAVWCGKKKVATAVWA